MKVKSNRPVFFLFLSGWMVYTVATASSWAAEPSEQHPAFIEGLRELDKTSIPSSWQKATGLKAQIKSVSHPRCFRPKIVFDGWYIDSQGKHESQPGDVLVDSLIMAKTPAASSYWTLIETDRGYLIVAAGGTQKGRVLTVDETVKTRPEGPDLTVSECLRLSSKITPACFWKITHTNDGVVVELLGGKYKRWCWDFAGGAQSFEQDDREVAKNVLLAEREVAGSYYDVEPKPER